MKFLTFDSTGQLARRLIKGVHDIPENAVKVDDKLWLKVTQETDGVWLLDAEGRVRKGPLPPLPEADLELLARNQRDALLRDAALRMAPLEDATELRLATPTQTNSLTAWRHYRRGLSRIELQDGFPASIAWPSAPV